MKSRFKEHYQYTEDELADIWKDAFFVFDTNALLNMYRYQRDTFSEYIAALKKLASRKKIFMPYHVGEEFFRNRLRVIREYKESYSDLLSLHQSFKSGFRQKYKYHPFIDIEKISEVIEKSLEETERELEEKQKAHPDWTKKDDILEEITAIFDGAVGDPYDEGSLRKIYDEGLERYENKIPPGYKDAAKGGNRQYGDLIVWKQMIDFAKQNSKPIIFITGDVKEDWWLINEGERLMPLPALKKEMREVAGVDFHAYTADRFLEMYSVHNHSGINAKTIAEVKRIREIQDETQDLLSIDSHEDPQSNDKLFTAHQGSYELLKLAVLRSLELLDDINIHEEILPDYTLESLARSYARLGSLSRQLRISPRASKFLTRKVEHELALLINSLEALCSDKLQEISTIEYVRKYLNEIISIRNTLLNLQS